MKLNPIATTCAVSFGYVDEFTCRNQFAEEDRYGIQFEAQVFDPVPSAVAATNWRRRTNGHNAADDPAFDNPSSEPPPLPPPTLWPPVRGTWSRIVRFLRRKKREKLVVEEAPKPESPPASPEPLRMDRERSFPNPTLREETGDIRQARESGMDLRIMADTWSLELQWRGESGQFPLAVLCLTSSFVFGVMASRLLNR